MKIDWFVKFLLLVIAIFLGVIALRPYMAPPKVEAQSGGVYPLYIEPGEVRIGAPDGVHGAIGKLVIDRRNGNVWGFPGFDQVPRPLGESSSTPLVSHPFLVGKYAFADVDK
ncbi:MAG: hypothetical protein P4N24_04510 [Acidobacteriota bacterium]|nr:hypothetical protein [Acidobacteriota bacterium]